jgi:hypothetical protein
MEVTFEEGIVEEIIPHHGSHVGLAVLRHPPRSIWSYRISCCGPLTQRPRDLSEIANYIYVQDEMVFCIRLGWEIWSGVTISHWMVCPCDNSPCTDCWTFNAGTHILLTCIQFGFILFRDGCHVTGRAIQGRIITTHIWSPDANGIEDCTDCTDCRYAHKFKKNEYRLSFPSVLFLL